MGFRVSSEAEEAGVDIALHAETAYSASSAGTGFHPLGAKAEAEVAAFNADDLLTSPSAKTTEKKVKA
jgi:Amt family ammonium transporter